jgi:phosphoribosylglycinamide formyltransferase-1
VIDRFSKGIINFHPGLIPEMRGLDCVQWSVYKELTLGMTAHLIDSRIDAGRIIKRVILPEYRSDTLIDLEHRLYQSQLEQFSTVIELVFKHSVEEFPKVALETGSACGSFPQELETEMMERFNKRFPLSGLVGG